MDKIDDTNHKQTRLLLSIYQMKGVRMIIFCRYLTKYLYKITIRYTNSEKVVLFYVGTYLTMICFYYEKRVNISTLDDFNNILLQLLSYTSLVDFLFAWERAMMLKAG